MLIWYNTFFVNYPLFYCTYWPHFPFFKRINEVSLNNKNRNCARKHFDWLDWIETCFEQPKRQNHLDEAKNRSKKQNKMKWCGKMWIKREYAAVFLTRGRGPLSSRSILLGLIACFLDERDRGEAEVEFIQKTCYKRGYYMANFLANKNYFYSTGSISFSLKTIFIPYATPWLLLSLT